MILCICMCGGTGQQTKLVRQVESGEEHAGSGSLLGGAAPVEQEVA